MEIKVIDSMPDLLALEPAWQRMWMAGRERHVFQHFEWARAFIESFNASIQWRVLTTQSDGVVTGLLPVACDHRTGFWRLLGSPNADYQHVLAGAEEARAMIRHLPLLGIRAMVFECLPEDSVLLRVLAGENGPLVMSPEKAECYYAQLTPETVAKVQRRGGIKDNLRRLSKQGPVEMHLLETVEERVQALATLFAQHRARWDSRGKPSQFHDPAMCAFYRRLCESKGLADLLHFSTLKVNGQEVACHLGFISNSTLIYYKPTYDPAVRGAGQVLLSKLMTEALQRGLSEIDFTRGGESYKTSLATGVRLNREARLFFSARARLCHVGTEWLRRRVPRDENGLAITTRIARQWRELIGGH